MHNVVKTITELPPGYDKSIDITMNDRDFDIVARNAIMLLIALTANNLDEAVDCIIHVWYSSFIRKSDLDILEQRVRPLIQTICDKTKEKPAGQVLGKTWTFGNRSLRLVLCKSAWDRLLAFLEIPNDLTTQQASDLRKAVTLAESRIDYRDHHNLLIAPAHRVAKQRFREDGILQPFGAGRTEFTIPNPTFFKPNATWPMHDSANPLNGWSAKEVEMAPNGPATSDIYGKLFNFLRSMLKRFIARVSNMEAAFQLLHVDAAHLPGHVQNRSFDRIEVSNISDDGYLGIRRTVALMAPLLRSPTENPHATLITLFMDGIEENKTIADQVGDVHAFSANVHRLIGYLPLVQRQLGLYDGELIKYMCAADLVRNHDHILDKISEKSEFDRFPHYLQAGLKEKHTIIEKWPFKLKLRPEQEGAQQEFECLLGGGTCGTECYLEWKRV
ncbi:hypothetical protein IL306_009010 [Fusarium sp. DS 682]|nr:hypothetical protein IL306_009010 [Fusarium sp. DS 682]